MRDADVRTALRTQLYAQHADDESLFVEELGLCEGEARIDLCVVNGSLNGYEIKSESDTLERLAGQEAVYSRALDFVTVVSGSRHLGKLAERVPEWWGLTEASLVDGEIVLVELRPGTRNPTIDPLAVAQLLWRDEALAELEARGLDGGVRSKPRKVLWQRLVETLVPAELGDVVRARLKNRQGWRERVQDGASA